MFMQTIEPTRARARLTLLDLDDKTDRIVVLYNPQQVTLGMSVDVGELKVVGCSHNVLMYGMTNSMPLELELYLSQWAASMLQSKDRRYIMEAIKWLASYALPPEPGTSPHRLVAVWPNTITTVLVVKNVQATITRWDQDLIPREATIRMSCIEYRRRFLTRGMMQGSDANWGASLDVSREDEYGE